MNQQELDPFLQRYISMWHEPDPQRRQAIVESLWAEDAENITSKFVVRGMAEILARVTRAHEQWVVQGGFRFRALANLSATHHHLVKFSWEMAPRAGGPAEARGVDVFVLRDDGRIGALYQFGEPLTP